MILRTEQGGVMVVELRHGKVNALDVELLAALRRELTELADQAAGSIVITGTGESFSAGVDLPRLLAGGEGYTAELIAELTATVLSIVRFPRPVVAAVNGHAIAGGCVLACACDYRLMAEGSGRVGLTELVVGVPFPGIALEVVRAVVPAPELSRLVFEGRLLTAQDSLRVGLVDCVVERSNLLRLATEKAQTLAEIPPRSFALTKQQLRAPLLHRLQLLGADHDARVIGSWTAPEVQTAIRGFVSQRLGKSG